MVKGVERVSGEVRKIDALILCIIIPPCAEKFDLENCQNLTFESHSYILINSEKNIYLRLDSINTIFTCTLWLLLSATTIVLSGPTQTPLGHVKCP